MAEFTKFVCWSPTGAASLISTEAVSPLLSVFTATHAPLRIFRGRTLGSHTGNLGAAVDEQAVRRDFLTRRTANGVLLMPVVGDSGTGKSHLVRWIREHTPSDEKRHVIYLPKLQTSLKAIITALLDQATGEQFDVLRNDVERVTSQLDETGLQHRLLNQLQEAVMAAPPPDGPARRLVGPDGLGALLLDPHVRQHLLQPQRLIPQLVANLLTDRREDAPERPWTFTIDDLPTAIDNPDFASRQAQRLLQIITTRPELQVAAVSLLNENLDAAVMNATVGVGRLQHALLEIRRLVGQQGKEIVLLIEDFALIQGVQRDLLDAVIEVGERDGTATLAPIRTLLAVTPGYLIKLDDTILTRARAASPHTYDLGKQFDDSPDGQVRLLSFVGRYLNAARLGRDIFDNATFRSQSDVPNACDTCDMMTACHAGFGTTAEGHGLYPFNGAALIRAIHARAPRDDTDIVNPRSVLGEVVRNVLVEHAASIREGEFPEPRFHEDYPTSRIDSVLPGPVRRAIDELDPEHAPRRALLLEFWGNAPSEVTNLAPEVHSAFALAPLGANAATVWRSNGAVDTRVAGTTDSVVKISGSTRKSMADVEQWLTRGVDLQQATAGAIRGLLSEAVARRIQWVAPAMAEPNVADIRAIWPPKSTIVSIEGAAAQNLPGTKDAPIELKRNPRNSVFFQGLLAANSGQIPGSAEHVRRLYETADAYAPALVERMRRERGTTDPELVLGLRASLIGALLAGRAIPTMSEAQLVNAVLDIGTTWVLRDRANRTDEWATALQRHLESRSELVSVLRNAFGFRRGNRGAIRLIDVAHLLPLLREASTDWTWSTAQATNAPAWVKTGVRGLNQVPDLVAGELDLLQSRLRQLRTLHPRGTRGRDVARSVSAALAAGTDVGYVPPNEQDFRRILAVADDIDWTAIDRLERTIDSWAEAEDPQKKARLALIVTGQDHGPALGQANELLQRSNAWLTDALESIATRARAAVSDAATEIEEVIAEWTTIRSRRDQ